MVVLISSLLVGDAAAQNRTCDAYVTWERMIEAKGGRLLVETVHATVISHVDARSGRLISTGLHTGPSFSWSFFDNGDPRLGRVVTHVYLDRGYSVEWLSNGGSGTVRRAPKPEKPYPFLEIPALFFETRWMKPSSLECRIDGEITIVAG